MRNSLAIDCAPLPFDSQSTLDDQIFKDFLEVQAQSLCSQDSVLWNKLSDGAKAIYRAIAISQAAMTIFPIWSVNEDEDIDNVQ